MRTSSIVRPPKASVNFQVRNFRLYGKLRKTDTEIHNSLPSIETIQTERSLSSFDLKRHSTPDNANYGEFYRCLASSLAPHSSRMDTVRSSTASARSVDVRPQSTFFTLTPLTSQSARNGGTDCTCTQPVLPRLSTSYSSVLLPTSQQTDGGSSSVSGSKSAGSKALSLQISSKLVE
ncbi:hypothetical protein ACOMHN_014166 [Nucella lapillus]